MKRFQNLTVPLFLLAWLLGAGCEELPPELKTPVDKIPVPTNLTVRAGSQSATLDWEFDASFAYSEFVVFRSEDDEVTFTELARVVSPPYADNNLRAGVVYWYRVAGVDGNGIVGGRSVSIPVSAALYEVLINDGDNATSDRNVRLAFTAPGFTQNVRVSENPALTGAPWQSYSPVLAFRLSAGDGVKTVYAEFADGTGNQSQVVSGSITLDTFAQIQSLSFSPATITPGGTVHFRIATTGSELNGECEVYIEGQGNTPVLVFDNGNNGDPVAGDGVYEIDYTFQEAFRQKQMKMSAVFFDEAGNGSVEVEFATDLFMTDPPAAVHLFGGAQDSTVSSITMRWTVSNERDFASYDIHRSSTPTVDPDISVLAGRVTQIGSNIFTDEDLVEGATYYYSVFVVNDFDEKTASNIASLSTDDLVPAAVTLDPPSSVDTGRLTLTWSTSQETDFARYEVRFETTPGVTATSSLAATITNRVTTFFDHTGLDTGANTYYYRVFVIDAAGNRSRSNEVNSP